MEARTVKVRRPAPSLRAKLAEKEEVEPEQTPSNRKSPPGKELYLDKNQNEV